MLNEIENQVDPRIEAIIVEGRNKVNPLSSILNTRRDPRRTTEQYTETDDLGVIETLNHHGWYISDYNEVKTHKSERQGFQKYCATYQNDALDFKTNEGRARIIQIGGHDGTTKLQLHAGFFRFACANGLVCGDAMFDPIKIKHIGELPLQLDTVVDQLVETCPLVFRRIDEMQRRELSPFDQLQFARAAADLRFADGQSVEVQDVVQVRRDADKGNSLWQVFNRVQENLLRPADTFKMVTANNRERKVKRITNIDTSLKLNKDLWHLAETYLRAA